MLKHKNWNKKNYDVLKNYILDENDVNKMYEKSIEKYPQLKIIKIYNNMGTRYLNNISLLNDVPNICSPKTITFSGHTDPTFIIDFDKKVIIVIMCNVMHNTTLSRTERKNITTNIINELCKKIY